MKVPDKSVSTLVPELIFVDNNRETKYVTLKFIIYFYDYEYFSVFI